MPVSRDAVMFALMHPAGAARLSESTWTFEPGVLLPLAIAICAYAIGVRRLWKAAGLNTGITVWQVVCYFSGCAALVAALMSPIDAMSAQLSSMHMVQHELLILVAAPLLVAGYPFVALLFVLPFAARQTVVRTLRARWLVRGWTALTAPAVVWLLHGAALWVWHLPALYEAALHSERVHAAEHASFFVTAALFWWGIAGGRYGRLTYGAAVVYVFATALHSGLLGAALTVSPSVWYGSYRSTAPAWALTPLEDQQLAGLIMWVPAGLIFTALGLAFFAAWLRESDRRAQGQLTDIRHGYGGTPASVLVVVALAIGALAATTACTGNVSAQASAMTGGDPGRGRLSLVEHGCDTCHTIPGIPTARGLVGPPLGGIASRVYIAGRLPNTPDNMRDWILRPHAHDPETVMPETGLDPAAARDVTAYLYTLR